MSAYSVCMARDKVRQFYTDQRFNAKKRGIEWYFTFQEWVRWWKSKLGPDWMAKRGKRRGQYVMARKGDKGPYAIWNVTCQLSSHNHYDYKHNKKIDKKTAKLIYVSNEKSVLLSKRFGLSRAHIRKIRQGKVWQNAP